MARVYVYLDPAYPRGILQLSQVEFIPQQTLSLTENRAHHIGALDHAVSLNSGVNKIFGRTNILSHEQNLLLADLFGNYCLQFFLLPLGCTPYKSQMSLMMILALIVNSVKS